MSHRFLLILLLLAATLQSCAQTTSSDTAATVIEDYPYSEAYIDNGSTPKREFRGVWVHTIGQFYFKHLNSEQIKDTLRKQLDVFQQCGFNVILFQVRPEADAFYKSDIEPWSRYLTGVQGQAPDDPDFDPMAFLIDECHKRCMEFHAWLNPYRANIDKTRPLTENHLYNKKRNMFVTYGSQLLFNPGVPECRDYICSVVKDIVTRYDIDAVHLDDYFYPYPVPDATFPDATTFKKYGGDFYPSRKGDWRRNNVNLLIKELSNTIHTAKPWVRFSISPFGIYRNKRQFAGGSNTNGLCCYDDLYADILLWVKKGWIDDCIPQLYWPDGHKAADYTTLINWWSENMTGPCKLYIGQDISRTYQQFNRKLSLSRSFKNIEGNCFFSGIMVMENMGNVQDSLRLTYHNRPALLPEYPNIDTHKPSSPENFTIESEDEETILSWDAPTEASKPEDEVRYYAIYMFEENQEINLNNMKALYCITPKTEVVLPDKEGINCKYIVVSAIDRMHNESMPVVIQYE